MVYEKVWRFHCWQFCLSAPLYGQKAFEFWPGTTYDSKVPTVRQVLGYEPGDKVTNHAGLVKYMDALAAAVPTRIKVFEYGESWEGRKLIYAAIGSEANIRKLGEIKSGIQRIADPRKTPEAEARRLIAGLPAVVWLSYGVHGNEISSPDAALVTAYHLLAARNDKIVEDVLSKVVVLIDPTQNPDGRDRFVNYFEQTRGLVPDANPSAAEHNEPWPGGRSNHYLFDLNRDWIGLTQPEILSQVKTLREWLPVVYVDLHEMGANSTYFFTPESDPYNPNLTPNQRTSLTLFGKNNAKWFDKYGFDYFTREEYDAFYPGYGASWPFYYGALSMTYEQASVRGLVVRRSDETLLTFRDTVRHHFVASISTLETAAVNREKLLERFLPVPRDGDRGRPEGADQGVHSAARPRRRRHGQTGRHPDGARHRSQSRHGAVQGGRKDVCRGDVRGADGAALETLHSHAARPRDQDGRQVCGRRRGAAQAETGNRNLRRDGLVAAAALQRGGDSPAARFPRAVSNRPNLRALCRAKCMAARRAWRTWCRGADRRRDVCSPRRFDRI